MLGFTRYLDVPIRLLMSPILILSGLGKLGAIAAMQGYMEAYGLPGGLIWPTIAFEVGGGVLLLLGLWTRPLALVAAGFCLVTAVIFHGAFADQVQRIMFLKNMAMAGGFLLLAKTDAPAFGLDHLIAARRGA